MLSAVIAYGHDYPAITPGGIAGTSEVRPARSSRTRASPPSSLLRLWQIETELSHDVLNPAHVPL